MAKRRKQSKPSNKAKANLVRIIAGRWRGRKLGVADVPGLRPTPDRVRETLFNWLQGYVHSARCLDLFAGSGALGLEALSRGAEYLTLVEKEPRAGRQLEANIALLKAENAEVVRNDALQFLQALDTQSQPYDLIFLDPPFHKGLLPQILEIISQKDLLAPSAMLYVEHEVKEDIDALLVEQGMVLHKRVKAGQVVSSLYKFHKFKELE